MVVGCYDPSRPKQHGPPPASLALPYSGREDGKAAAAAAPAKSAKDQRPASGKQQQGKQGGGGAGSSTSVAKKAGEGGDESKVAPLPTMDIFAGCGGLSEGFHQVCVDQAGPL